MRRSITIVLGVILISSCVNSQTLKQNTPQLIGACEGCEAIFEYGNRKISNSDTLPGFNEEGIKINITGTVYLPDGKTPAKDVILYIYHTNQQGEYATNGSETGWGKRHGSIKGWIKTDSTGQYSFYTLQPGIYPDRSSPAHIHLTILEPNGKYYWLESYHFEGDSLLTNKDKSPTNPRGGSSGIISLQRKGTIAAGTRDIILGRNVPGYR